MPNISQQELKAHLASGALASLYLLTGEEKLTLRRAAQRLIKKAADDPFPQFNQGLFSNDSDIENIVSAAEALPFMARHKCVAVADLNPETKNADYLDHLYGLLDDLPDTTTLIFHYPTLDIPERPSAKWKKFLEKLRRNACAVDFPHLKPADLRQALERAAGRQGCTLARRSADKLIESSGGDLHILYSEIEKLCAYTLGTGRKEITPDVVDLLTPKSTETTVFNMVNALTAGRCDEAYSQLDLLFYNGEEPVSILAAIASSYIAMYRVKTALESNLTSAAPAEYAPQYRGGNSFRLERAGRSAARLSLETLAKCLDLLMEADTALKSSKLDDRLVLEGLISKLLMAVQTR